MLRKRIMCCMNDIYAQTWDGSFCWSLDIPLYLTLFKEILCFIDCFIRNYQMPLTPNTCSLLHGGFYCHKLMFSYFTLLHAAFDRNKWFQSGCSISKIIFAEFSVALASTFVINHKNDHFMLFKMSTIHAWFWSMVVHGQHG